MKCQPVRSAARVVLASLVVGACIASSAVGAQAATPNPEPGALELKNSAVSKKVAAESMVLLENHDDTLPMAKSGNIALFGVGAYSTPVNGVGSGTVYNRHSVGVREGLENSGYTITTSDSYWNALGNAFQNNLDAPVRGVWGPTINYSSAEQPLTASSAAPKAATDTAIYVLTRTAGENYDRSSGPGDYAPTATELANMSLLGQTYEHVVVLINTNGVVDTSFFKDLNVSAIDPSGGRALDALLYMGQAGQETGTALVDVLNGTTNPSGKLTDTWATKYAYYPASATFANNDAQIANEEYTEGIYVGYRYFDSFYETINPENPDDVVAYPFGYGASYTEFEQKTQKVTTNGEEVTVEVQVTNVGKAYSGKDVTQVYFSAPAGSIDKPYQQLAAFAKTDVLGPGDSQVLTLSFDTSQMASYNADSASWKLDAGRYVIRVGDSSRDTQVAAKLDLSANVTTEQVSNQLTDQKPSSELTSNPSDFYTYASENAELSSAPTLALDTGAIPTRNRASTLDQDVPVGADSPYYPIDGNSISSITAHVPSGQTDWEGTGEPYTAKTGESVQPASTRPGATLYDVEAGRTSMRDFVAGLSVEQLANIVEGSSTNGSYPNVAGAAGYTTGKYEALGIPAMVFADGTSGLRLTQELKTTPTTYQFSTNFPVASMVAQTWNVDLVREMSDAVANEMEMYGISTWLAPGLNIHRDPLNGRNFEYYSEDPVLTGLIAVAAVEGVQAHPGMGAVIKHLAANNQETGRRGNNSVVGERALREVELRGFEIAVKGAQPMGAMTAYNKLNGTYTSQDYDLNSDILRGEWGFEGLVVSDWGGSHDAVATMYAGNDLIEPGGRPQDLIDAIKQVAPSIDVSGLPVYNKTINAQGVVSYSWLFGALTPSATGATTIETTVDSTTDLSRTPASGTTTIDVISNQVFAPDAAFASVNDAFVAATGLLTDPSALSGSQKSGLAITDVVREDPASATSAVTSFTVVVQGDYTPRVYTLRLGDLQRSASRVLDAAMRSTTFARLAADRGVIGVTVEPYADRFDLDSGVSVSRGPVLAAVIPSDPTPTSPPTPTTPAPGSAPPATSAPAGNSSGSSPSLGSTGTRERDGLAWTGSDLSLLLLAAVGLLGTGSFILVRRRHLKADQE